MSNNTLIIKYSKGGYKLQAFVDKALYNDFKFEKKGIRDICLSDTLATEAGEKLSEEVMTTLFGTSDVWKCFEEIVMKGEPQYSIQERREMTENRRKQIVEYIVRTYINPQTNLPHPATRIENGMKSIKGLKIDLNVGIAIQGDNIVKQLKSSMAFVKNETHGYIYIPLEYSGKTTSVLRKWCEIRRSKYTDTHYKAEITFATTQMSSFINEMTQITNGNFKFEDDSQPGATAETSVEPQPKKGAKGKKGKK